MKFSLVLDIFKNNYVCLARFFDPICFNLNLLKSALFVYKISPLLPVKDIKYN